MASKLSRWAADDDIEDAAVAAARRKEKEEKRRLKEDRAQRAAAAVSAASAVAADTGLPTSTAPNDERPAKRRRMSPAEAQDEPDNNPEATNLLSFPNPGFGTSASIKQYTILNSIEEGSYGHVSRARASTTGDIVALKKLKMENTSDGFPVTALREIQTLRACSHPNIVSLREVVVGDALSE
jgi:cell division cycle 2-like